METWRGTTWWLTAVKCQFRHFSVDKSQTWGSTCPLKPLSCTAGTNLCWPLLFLHVDVLSETCYFSLELFFDIHTFWQATPDGTSAELLQEMSIETHTQRHSTLCLGTWCSVHEYIIWSLNMSSSTQLCLPLCPAAGSPAGPTSIFLTTQHFKGDACKTVDRTAHATNKVAKRGLNYFDIITKYGR